MVDIDIVEEKRKGTFFDFALILIIILTSTFSAYTTYKGFSYDIPELLAGFLCVVIGLSLLAINLKIRETRIKGGSLLGPFVAFFLVFVFSFISNTNAIYTFFIERDIIGETQETAWKVFDAETQKILDEISRLPQMIAYSNWHRDLKITRENLKRQIQDPNNPGLGQLAQNHLKEVEDILGAKTTSLRAPHYTAPMSEHKQYANALDKLIVEQVKVQSDNHPAMSALQFREKIRKAYAIYESAMVTKNYNIDTIDLMERDLNSYKNLAHEIISPDLAIRSIYKDAYRTGSFRYTWRNFVNLINPAAIILSILLGSLLDLLAPLLSVLLYRYEEEF